MKIVNSLEFRRKIVHMLIGIAAILLIINKVVTPFIIFIILVIGVFLSFLSLRVRVPILCLFLDNFQRPSEKGRLPGRAVIFAVAGSLLVLQLFERDIALASIMILTFADPISHLIGKNYGKTKSFLDEKKNIEGHIAGAIISSLFAMLIIHPVLAIAGSLTAMLFESVIIEIQKIQLDDNLIIPLAAGTAMFLIVKFFM